MRQQHATARWDLTQAATAQPTSHIHHRPPRHHAAAREGTAIATIDELLEQVDSKYTLVHLAARRAREINAYYHSLGEGLGRYTPPLVDRVESNKPLSIALEEIAQGKIVAQEPGEALRVAEQLLGGEDDASGDADVVSLVEDDEGGGDDES